ncbi:MAG: MmgE/PrpD family protein [Alkalilacustris sp.]
MDILDRVAGFAANTRTAAIPAEVLDKTALILADSLGAILGGMAEPEVRALVAGLGPSGPAAVVGAGRGAAPGQAALVNGTAGTTLEMDEGSQFARGHPGLHTIPAALAFAGDEAARGRTITGPDLLAAFAIGYEVGARVGMACNLRPSLHPHGTWGAICAAVAVARLAGRDAGQMRHAITMAASFALAPSRRTMLEGGTVRNALAGVSGQLGLVVHDLLSAGFEGDRDGLGQVFGRTLSDGFRPEAMTEALGSRWEVMRNYFKLHACCRFNHATLDALALIVAQEGPLDPASVAGVEVHSYAFAAELDDPAPRNMLAARFSVPFAVATALVTGRTDIGSFTAEALADPVTRALATRVRVVEDPAMTAALPDRRPARVILTLRDGRRLQAETATNRGDWADPYTTPELRTKFLSLATRVWPEGPAAALWDATLALPGQGSSTPWLDSLSMPADVAAQ